MSVLVQGVAISFLTPYEYGIFALCYIVLALGSTVVYSVICEPWSSAHPNQSDWPDYSMALTAIAALSILPSAVVGALVGELGVALLLGVAAAGTIYRVGARYFAVFVGERRYVAPADNVGVLVLCLGWLLLYPLTPSLYSLSSSWALAALVSAGLSKRPSFGKYHLILGKWIRGRWDAMRFLVLDSVLLEAGATGVPLVMTPTMGLAQFGVYRSVSSAAVPVRMILNPIRPNLARRPVRDIVGVRVGMMVFALGIALAGVVYSALRLVVGWGPLEGTALRMLGEYSLPVGIFVFSNTVGTFFYLALRQKMAGRVLMRYRVVQLVLALALPVGGYLLRGLGGAIWGYVSVSVLMAGICWAMLRSWGTDGAASE